MFCSRCGTQVTDADAGAGGQPPSGQSPHGSIGHEPPTQQAPAFSRHEPPVPPPAPPAPAYWAAQQSPPAAPAYEPPGPPPAAPAYEPQSPPPAAPAYWGPQQTPAAPPPPAAPSGYEPQSPPAPAAPAGYEPPGPPPAAPAYWATQQSPPGQPGYGSPSPAPAAPAYGQQNPPPAAPAHWGQQTPPPPGYGPTVGYQQPGAPPYMPQQPGAPGYAPPRRQRSRGIALAAAIVVVLAILAVAGWKAHWPSALFGKSAPKPLTWSAAQAPLPADAERTSSQSAGLDDIACPGTQSCVTIGYYNSTGSSSNGIVETLSRGTWIPSTGAAEVAAGSKDTFVYLEGITCQSQTSCVTVGSYFNSQNVQKPLIETLSGTTWTSDQFPLPGDAEQGKPALLTGVACPAAGTCVATGWYTGKNGDTQGMIDTLSGGAWTTARAPLPAGAVPHPQTSTSVPTALFVVKCPAVGTCVAVGDYTNASGASEGLIDTLSGTTWTAATAPLPADAAASPAAYLWAVTCPGSGSCLAVGNYSDRNGQNRNLVETQSGGTWTPLAAPFPAGAAASQKWNPDEVTGLTSVACQTAGACVAAGSYTARNGTVLGMIDTLSGGTWTAAKAPLPAGAATAKQYVFIDSAVCPADGDCVAVGGYNTANGASQGLIETARAKS